MRQRNRLTLLFLMILILIGGYLRLYNLGLPSFWVDELDFVQAARSMATVGEPRLDSGYLYPRAPLFTLSLMASFRLFDVSEFSSRLPSAIFGILSIPMIFVMGRGLFNERVGLMSALFLTISPFAIGWSRSCRMYALFQLLFLAGVYVFYRGFEASANRNPHSHKFPLAKRGRSEASDFAPGEAPEASEMFRFSQHNNHNAAVHNLRFLRVIRSLILKWQINLPLLFLGGIILLLSYSSHESAGLFLLSFVAYLGIYAMYFSFKDGIQAALSTKYFVVIGVIIAAVTLAYLLLPPVREFLKYAVLYQPKWAEVASAQNPWRIVEFLLGSGKIPFNLFFLAGLLLILKRNDQGGIFSLLTLFVPVILFSFVFQYRKNDYVFHVYPIFYLVAAYALDAAITKLRDSRPFIKLFTMSAKFHREWILTLFCVLWIPLSFNLRFAQKIPRLPDGSFNGAIYHNEWKEAAGLLRDTLAPDEVLISTLPLTIKYYLGRAEFNLNWSNGDLALQKHVYSPDGRLVDFYSGADIIENLPELKLVLRKHPNGWLVVDNYRFGNDVYVPADVRHYIEEHLSKVYVTQRKTVSVYRWQSNSDVSATN